MNNDRARPTVLILTGTCGVGKSTTARAWAASRGGAAVSGDDIRGWMRNKIVRRENGYQNDLVGRLSAEAALEFIELGLDVALDFVWTPTTLRYLRERLSPVADIHAVWLRCEASENRQRDAERPANVVMGARVEELQRELDAIDDWPAELRRIDTTTLNVNALLAKLRID